MKSFKTAVSYMSIIVVVLFTLGPRAYHIFHPELTEMQLILQFWWSYLMAAAGAGLFIWGMSKVKE